MSGEIASLISKRKSFKRTMWNFKTADFDGFREKLGETIWDDCFETEDPNLVCESWTQNFLNIAKKIVNSKTVVVRPNDKTWYCNFLV